MSPCTHAGWCPHHFVTSPLCLRYIRQHKMYFHFHVLFSLFSIPTSGLLTLHIIRGILLGPSYFLLPVASVFLSVPVFPTCIYTVVYRLVPYWLKSTKKGKFLYSAVSSPQDRSKRFTLYFSDRPVHPDTISASLGRIQPYATINARRLLVHISITVYSQVLIYSAE